MVTCKLESFVSFDLQATISCFSYTKNRILEENPILYLSAALSRYNFLFRPKKDACESAKKKGSDINVLQRFFQLHLKDGMLMAKEIFSLICEWEINYKLL